MEDMVKQEIETKWIREKQNEKQKKELRKLNAKS
jgi:hypothetical protein